MQPVSALLRVLVAILVRTLAALLAVVAALLLLTTLFFVAISLRVLLVLLVGGVSHFPYSFCHALPSDRDTCATHARSRCCAASPERGEAGTGGSSPRQPAGALIGSFDD